MQSQWRMRRGRRDHGAVLRESLVEMSFSSSPIILFEPGAMFNMTIGAISYTNHLPIVNVGLNHFLGDPIAVVVSLRTRSMRQARELQFSSSEVQIPSRHLQHQHQHHRHATAKKNITDMKIVMLDRCGRIFGVGGGTGRRHCDGESTCGWSEASKMWLARDRWGFF